MIMRMKRRKLKIGMQMIRKVKRNKNRKKMKKNPKKTMKNVKM